MKKYVFAVLALTLPAFGTITAVQSDANLELHQPFRLIGNVRC